MGWTIQTQAKANGTIIVPGNGILFDGDKCIYDKASQYGFNLFSEVSTYESGTREWVTYSGDTAEQFYDSWSYGVDKWFMVTGGSVDGGGTDAVSLISHGTKVYNNTTYSVYQAIPNDPEASPLLQWIMPVGVGEKFMFVQDLTTCL